MVCGKCATENEASRKFCSSCGAPLGTVCDRCGTVNGPDDGYCGRCGFALAASTVKGLSSPVPKAASPNNLPPQYSVEDIEVLLSLRRTLEKGRDGPQTLDQEEIDRLFA
jgi:hypothetical protein